jgi:hypothetical protein
VLTIAGCATGNNPIVCTSNGGEPGTVPNQRMPDSYCRDDMDQNPVYVWQQVAQGSSVPPIGQVTANGQRVPAVITGGTPQPSGAAQEDDEPQDAGVNPQGSPSANAGEEDEEEANQSSISEDEDSEVSSSVSVSEDE